MEFDVFKNIYYAATANGVLHFSTDKGVSWDTASIPSFRADILDIALDPQSPDVIYLAYNRSGQRIHMVRRTSTFSQFSFSRSDITSDFPPGLNVYSLAVDPKKKYVLYAGTQRGVYKGRSFDGGNSWVWNSYNMGMPKAVHVSDLEIYDTTGLLRAATKGRGIYSIQNYHSEVFVEVIPNSQEVIPGNTAKYAVFVKNLSAKTKTFKLTASGLGQLANSFDQSVLQIGPQKKQSAILSIQAPSCYKGKKIIFSVNANDIQQPLIFGRDQSELKITPGHPQLNKDIYEDNDKYSKATPITLHSATNNLVHLKNLSLHSPSDVDYYKIKFFNDPKVECAGKGPKKFGSFMSAFNPKYSPGKLSIHVKGDY